MDDEVEMYVLLEHRNELNKIIKDAFKTTTEIKFKSFEVSRKHVILGANSGAVYIFLRENGQFFKLIPTSYGSAILLSASTDGRSLAVATSTGYVLILKDCFNENSHSIEPQLNGAHSGHTVTSLMWNSANELYAGDNLGRISVTLIANFLSKTIFQSSNAFVMHLDSQIVQIDSFSRFLLISTQTRTVLCNTETERFIQIGRKLRKGQYGACFYTPQNFNQTQSTQSNSLKNGVSREHEIPILDGVELFEVFCTRPGTRLWRIDSRGDVKSTHNYKESILQRPPGNCVIIGEKSTLKTASCVSENFVPNFGKILKYSDNFLVTFEANSIYILDVKHDCLLMWTDCFQHIKDVRVFDRFLYVWHSEITVLSLSTLESLVLMLLKTGLYEFCAELCLNYQGDVEKLLNQSRIFHISVLNSRLSDDCLKENLRPIFALIDKVREKNNAEKYAKLNAKRPVLQLENVAKQPKTYAEILLEEFEIHKNDLKIDNLQDLNLVDYCRYLIEFIDHAEEEKKKSATKWCFRKCLKRCLKHVYDLQLNDDVPDDVRDLIFNAFLNENPAKGDSCKNCIFPMPFAHENRPNHLELGLKFLATNKRDDCLKRVPYFYGHILRSLTTTTEIVEKLPLIVQYSDLGVIDALKVNFTYDTWERTLNLLVELTMRSRCLQCGHSLRVAESVGGGVGGAVKRSGQCFKWNMLALRMVQSINPVNTLKILKRYSPYIANGELDGQFYLYCIVSRLNQKSDNEDDNCASNKFQQCETTTQSIVENLYLNKPDKSIAALLTSKYLGGK